MEFKKVKRAAWAVVGVAALGMGVRGCWYAQDYIDLPVYIADCQEGRTRNGLASLIVGTVAHELYDEAHIAVTVEKTSWPDSHITGSLSPDSLHTEMDLRFTDSKFYGHITSNGLEGEISKSEWNWDIEQTAPGCYDVTRFGFKWNAELRLNIADGKIEGTYARSGLKWDWDITGHYDNKGNVALQVSIPWGADFSMKGTIIPRK